MLANHLRIAFRNLLKNKVFSLVNLLGLTVGLSASWMIGLYVADELRYDRYHANADRIFRVVHEASWDGGHLNLAVTSAPFAPALKQDYADVEEAVRMVPEGGGTLKAGNRELRADDIYFADANVFRVFTYPFLAGDPKTALTRPEAIVLSRTLAEKLFGSPEKALHQTVYFSNHFGNLVTGVMEDVPTHSHLNFSALRSLPAGYTNNWQSFGLYTYLLLRSGSDPTVVEKKLARFFPDHLQKEMGEVRYQLSLQPLPSIHLHSHRDYEAGANGDLRYVIVFSLIAGLIVLVAAINYMNLSTARAALRVREVGVRKAIGSGRGQLAGLFLTESVLLTVLAAVAGIFLTELLLPFFNTFSGKDLSLWSFGPVWTAGSMLLLCLLAGLLAGSYPAVFLSGLRPIPALKGELGRQATAWRLRKVLVTGQFVVTIVMLIGSAVIFRQMQFTSRKDLGFNREQVLSFHIPGMEVRKRMPQLKEQLLRSPWVQAASAASNPIGNNNIGTKGFHFEVNGKIAESSIIAQRFEVDEDFLPTMEISLIAGRNFDKKRKTDIFESVLVNEALVRQLGWKDPVGRQVEFRTGANNEIQARSRVVGVVKDFHIYSLQHKIEPLILQLPFDFQQDNVYVRIRPEHAEAALKDIGRIYRQFDPENAFDYQFLDENFARQYAGEIRQGNLLLAFTGLTIFIACLGLFGLVTFLAEQRTKEIGIRKVLGAGVPSLVGLLSRDLLVLVGLAALLAFPIAWLLMSRWLEGFAYRVGMDWWLFAGAGLTAGILALLTIGTQAYRAATANPVKSLKNE